MQNHALVNLAQQPVKRIISRLVTEASPIFGEYNEADYQNLIAVFERLNQAQLNDENVEDLREFIDYGIIAIARRYDLGQPIHPGTMNILIMAIQAFNRAYGHPYQFGVEFIEGITPATEDFMVGVVQPMTQNLQLLALHHAEWINPVFVAREAARRAREEAPGAETRVVRTLAQFRSMGGDAMEAECPVCMEEFIEVERPADPNKSKRMKRSPIFMPVVFHKDEKGKWFHPMHTVCATDAKKDECPMCRVKVIWPKIVATRKTRRPNSEPTRSMKRSSMKRSSTKRRSTKRRSTKRRSTSVRRKSADF
jgi:hypothetical protein